MMLLVLTQQQEKSLLLLQILIPSVLLHHERFQSILLHHPNLMALTILSNHFPALNDFSLLGKVHILFLVLQMFSFYLQTYYYILSIKYSSITGPSTIDETVLFTSLQYIFSRKTCNKRTSLVPNVFRNLLSFL